MKKLKPSNDIDDVYSILDSTPFLKTKKKIAKQIAMLPLDFVDFAQIHEISSYTHAVVGKIIWQFLDSENVSNHDCMLRSRTARTFALK